MHTLATQWTKLHEPTRNCAPLVFPEEDLLLQLVDLYFERQNLYFPFLHRPTFEQSLLNGLHKVDRDFGELVLSVCALGARHTSDPRAFAEGSTSLHSLGWKYMEQIILLQDVNHSSALYRVQTIINAIMFLQPTSLPGACWSLLGLGVKFAQIVGAHRRNFAGRKGSLVGELWKRAFWCLVVIDTFMCSFLGRPKATNPADYDLDFPLACDDEYWLHPDPEQAFKQPAGRPSVISFFVHYLKLLDIFGLAQRTIYAVKKPERWASNTAWDESIVVELDSALNTWVDTMPDHLRWDPHREDDLFFTQSATLYATLYWVHIQIHRPFISLSKQEKASSLSYSSLAVCVNAARSCARLLDRLHARGGNLPMPNVWASLFMSTIILLLNLWSGRKLGLATDPIRDMQDVNKCLEALSEYESRCV
ncbi:fungal-specific transcription factor domain-containing protein [Rhodocollybia butyracea]|uniref:Fungal-specific transcription factor domain-containing protein n=1 Tax=Rhodocollybia butyracea TaxID=206335 RepID=A0A9P5PNG4_9AGAR|nr:fungal-specific transcription factor domain-containing protein [Rhodocollybia butyracea]